MFGKYIFTTLCFVQLVNASSIRDSITSPLNQDEIMRRVRNAYTNALDVDDIAADIDLRGIDFEVDTVFANKIRFFRAASVTNALWRANDRRKALMTKPNNVNKEPLKELIESNSKSLPFIEQTRTLALEYVSSLPNFIVREQVQRYMRSSSGNWKLGDYLELEVSYVAGRGEELKLKHQNGSTTNFTLDEIGGLTSTGQFAGQLEMLFSPESKTEFSEQNKIDFYGHSCRIYKYQVAVQNSHQQLKIEKASVITGYRGQIYIQEDTKQILRIEQETTDIPFDFPLSAATSVVDFGWVNLNGKNCLLPVNAQVMLTLKQKKTTALNCITFHKYSKFETDVKVIDE